MVLQQDTAFLLQRDLDHAGEHAEHAGEQHPQVYLAVHDLDRRVYGLAHRGDVEVELVTGPARLNLRAAGDMLLKLMNIVRDAPPRLVLAEVVGKVDIDGLSHCCDVGRRSALFKLRQGSMVGVMKWIVALLAGLFATAVVAQPAPPQPATAQPAVPWDPVAP